MTLLLLLGCMVEDFSWERVKGAHCSLFLGMSTVDIFLWIFFCFLGPVFQFVFMITAPQKSKA